MRAIARRPRVLPTTCRLGLEPLEDRCLLAAGGVETAEQAVELFGLSPALFVENQGQWADESVRYAFFGDGANVLHTDAGPVFQLFQRDVAVGGDSVGDQDVPGIWSPSETPLTDGATNIQTATFSVHFDGAGAVAPVGLDQLETVHNYFVGEQSAWRSSVPTFETVAYPGLYEGIDLLTWGRRTSLKYEFHVAPGADYRQIQVRYEGAGELRLDDFGALHVTTPLGELVDDAPYIYQTINGRQVPVPGTFQLLTPETYTFHLTGDYDPSRELIIDPDLDWGTYVGGNSEDSGQSIAVDSRGDILVAGYSYSPTWVMGGFNTIHNDNNGGGVDAFIVKVSSSGDHVWSTYIGGNQADFGYDIAVDSDDNVLMTGRTSTAEWVSGGFDSTFNGSHDAFVVKLSPTGGHLWSTYLGGTRHDTGVGIAVDSFGNALVTGKTESWEWISGGFDTTYDGDEDAFVAKLSSTGAHLWSTFLGGSAFDEGNDIAVDGVDNVIVTGTTWSSLWVSGGFDETMDGFMDGFVAKLSPTGAHLWSTYVGGNAVDRSYDVAATYMGDVFVTGITESDDWASGGYDTMFDGKSDGFVAKLSPIGAHLWSTYIGGNSDDWAASIAVGATGDVAITGVTASADWTSGGYDTHWDGSDGFVAMISGLGEDLWSTYFGGAGIERGFGVAVDSVGNVLVTGETVNDWFFGGYDTTFHSLNSSGFVAKFSDDSLPRVVDSSIREGDARGVDTLKYSARFSERIDLDGVIAENVVLVGDTVGTIAPISVSFHPVTFILGVTLPSLAEDDYTLTLHSGEGGFKDLTGNQLDGERHATATVPSGDGAGGGDFVIHFSIDGTPPQVMVGRHVFYNNSFFDFNTSSFSLADNRAIAVDKEALLPGMGAGVENYVNHPEGITGVMVDVAGLAEAGITLGNVGESFEFRAGNTADPATWPVAALPREVAVRPGEGASGSDRVTLIWDAADAVKGAWLQVTVRATAATGLAEEDVFYFGSAPGDAGVGNLANVVLVDAQDRAAIRNNGRDFTDPAGVDDPHDLNRDGLVNAADRAIPLAYPAGPLTGLLLFTAPNGAPVPVSARVSAEAMEPAVEEQKIEDEDEGEVKAIDRRVVGTQARQGRQAVAAVFEMEGRRDKDRPERARAGQFRSEGVVTLAADSSLRRHRAAHVDRVMEDLEGLISYGGSTYRGRGGAK